MVDVSCPKIQNLKIIFVLFINCLLFLGLRPPSGYSQDKIVAIVNNDVITQKDFNEFVNFTRVQLRQEYMGRELESKVQSMKLDLLEKLIEDQLILQEARKVGINVDDSRIKAKIGEIKDKYGSERTFEEALRQQGMVQSDLEKKIREQFLMYNFIEYKIRSKININPCEVTQFYQDNPDEFKKPEERVFESVSMADQNVANNVYNSLKKGGNFEGVAKDFSLSVNRLTADRSGELKKEIENVVFGLGKDKFSLPVKIGNEYYIFKLIEIIPPRQFTLVEVQDKIYTYLFNKKMQEMLSAWLDQTKKQSYIKIFEDQ